jgi:predicted restriction endonuclease
LVQKGEKIVCSHSCSNTYFRSGENNPNYKDGFDGDKAYRKICFKYHSKKCCICGFEHIVEVHHMDCNKNNNDPNNLVPLCPNHHRMFHSRYRQLVTPLIEEYINNNRV